VPIPTNRPPIRKKLPTRVFGTSESKWQAIVEDVVEQHRTGRPVLVGTRSIDKSELLANMLMAHGLETTILNARHVAQEAEIVAEAGKQGKITVATNMAGRGTDIKLGEGVEELGGLHVVCTELHESQRLDRQRTGRRGRQAAPGTYRQFLPLDDEILLMGFGPKRAKKLKELGERQRGEISGYERLFYHAQHKVERRHFRDRKIMLYFE